MATKQQAVVKCLIRSQEEMLYWLEAALEWIDTVPDDVVLPTMPGFCRDTVNESIVRAKKVQGLIVQEGLTSPKK